MLAKQYISAWLGIAFACALAAGSNVAAAEDVVKRGPVSASVAVAPEKVRIGDAVELTLTVRAEAKVEVLMPTFGESLERFDILEFTPEERVDDDGSVVHRQRYRLYAGSSGAKKIPPLIIEFVDRRPGQRPAPEGEDAYELLTSPLTVTVESVVPQGAGGDLKGLPGPLGPRTKPSPNPAPGLVVALIGVMITSLGLVAYWWYRRGRVKAQSAYEIALERLARLRALPRPNAASTVEMDAFFVELSGLVRRYLEDRFALHAPELTTEEFLDIAAASPDLTESNRSFLQDFLRTADEVKFARRLPKASYPDLALSAVGSFLEHTRERGEAPHA